jgi:hypothetical protein
LPQKVRDVDKALKKKGFQESGKPNPDHDYYVFHYKGKKTQVITKISHGEKELHDRLCSRMAQQLRLNTRQFHDFVDCGLTYEAYVTILVQAKIVGDM